MTGTGILDCERRTDPVAKPDREGGGGDIPCDVVLVMPWRLGGVVLVGWLKPGIRGSGTGVSAAWYAADTPIKLRAIGGITPERIPLLAPSRPVGVSLKEGVISGARAA